MTLERPLPVNVRDIQDQPLRGAQRRRGSLRQEQGCAQIRGDQVVELVDRDRADRGRVKTRCVVDQHIEPSEILEGRLDQAGQTGHVGEVRRDGDGRTGAHRIELSHELGGLGDGRMVMNRDRRTGRVQVPRRHRAKASRGTRNQNAASCQGKWSVGHPNGVSSGVAVGAGCCGQKIPYRVRPVRAKGRRP